MIMINFNEISIILIFCFTIIFILIYICVRTEWNLMQRMIICIPLFIINTNFIYVSHVIISNTILIIFKSWQILLTLPIIIWIILSISVTTYTAVHQPAFRFNWWLKCWLMVPFLLFIYWRSIIMWILCIFHCFNHAFHVIVSVGGCCIS